MSYIRKRVYPSGKESYVVGFKDQHGHWREVKAGERRKDAEVLLRRIEAEVAAGTYGVVREDPTLALFAERFLRAKKGEVKGTSHFFYYKNLQLYVIPYMGRLRLSQITPSRVQQLLLDLEEAGKSPATRAKALRVLRVVLRWAVSLELIPRDPTAAIRAPRIPRKEANILTPPQFERLLKSCDGELYVLVAIAGMAGLREGEIVALRWRDIALEAGAIQVSRNYIPGHGFSDLKTRNARRRVPMLPALRGILEDLYRSQGGPARDNLLFSNSAGKPLDRAKFYPRFKRALEKAGIPDMSFHDLRHFYASLAVAGGMNPRALMEVMGHGSIQTTMNLYASLFPGAHNEAVERMQNILEAGDKVVYLTHEKDERTGNRDLQKRG